MAKERNTLKKMAEKKIRADRRRREKNTVIFVVCGLMLFFAVIAIFPAIRNERTFIYEDGAYIDPSNGKTYCPADMSAYLIKTEFYEDDLYGTMRGDKVYTIPGVKGRNWLVRQLDDDLYELYYEENVLLPSISEFEASEMYLFVDEPLILYREEIKDKTELDNIVSALVNGEKTESIGEFNETYSIRFVSEKYGHMYFCFEYVITDNGSYFYDHLSFSYIKANGMLDGYVESLKEQRDNEA